MDHKELERVLRELKEQLDELNKTIINSFSDKFKKELVEINTQNGQSKN